MCTHQSHTCYCGKVYLCSLPNWVCPTVNGDEDANLCEVCLERFAQEMQAWVDDGGEHQE